MAYNEKLADRVRERLEHIPRTEEKRMFGGLCFMVDDKMCVCVSGDELMCRISPAACEAALELNGIRPMIHGGRNMKGYVYVSADLLKTAKDLDHWVNLCLDFNREARSSKSKK